MNVEMADDVDPKY